MPILENNKKDSYVYSYMNHMRTQILEKILILPVNTY